MHLISLSEVRHSEKSLTQAVLQVTQLLGIYHAELARILHLQCADIGEMGGGGKTLVASSEAWEQALMFIELYECLYQYCSGEEACMHNWLRKQQPVMQGAPLYLMVDELRIKDVILCIRQYG